MITRTDHTDNIEAGTARTLGILSLALFFAMHNISAVFYQMRGVSPSHFRWSMIGYFSGVALTALFWPALEKRMSSPGRAGSAWRWAGFAALIFPPVFCLLTPFLIPESFAGNVFLNSFQPMLWACYLPVAFRFFFGQVNSRSQGLYLGLAMGGGHLCWALLVPLLSGTAESRHLLFLNITRGLVGVAFALVVRPLFPRRPAEVLRGLIPDAATEPIPPGPGPKIRLLLISFIIMYFLNGLLGYLFFVRMVTKGVYPEYMHLLLAGLFPVLGLLISRRGDEVLKNTLTVAVICFSSVPLLLILQPGSTGHLMTYMVCSSSLQLVLMAGTAAAPRFLGSGRYPVVILCFTWLSSSFSLVGGMVGGALGRSPAVHAGLALGLLLGLLSIPMMRRAFPGTEPGREILADEPDPPAEPDSAWSAPDEARSASYARRHGLSPREIQVMDLLLKGASTGDMAAALSLKESSVRHYVRTLLKKTGAGSRLALVTAILAWKEPPESGPDPDGTPPEPR